MYKGWSINLTIDDPDQCFEVEFPVSCLFMSRHGPVLELVFWSDFTQRWLHVVSGPFVRQLPPGHVQVCMGDLPWVDEVVRAQGVPTGVCQCVQYLESQQVPR